MEGKDEIDAKGREVNHKLEALEKKITDVSDDILSLNRDLRNAPADRIVAVKEAIAALERQQAALERQQAVLVGRRTELQLIELLKQQSTAIQQQSTAMQQQMQQQSTAIQQQSTAMQQQMQQQSTAIQQQSTAMQQQMQQQSTAIQQQSTAMQQQMQQQSTAIQQQTLVLGEIKTELCDRDRASRTNTERSARAKLMGYPDTNRCVLTGETRDDLLKCAHIVPSIYFYQIPDGEKQGDFVMMRRDLERRFDNHEFTFDPAGKVVVLWSSAPADVQNLHGLQIPAAQMPSVECLRRRWDIAQREMGERCPDCWKRVGAVNIGNHKNLRRSCPRSQAASGPPAPSAPGSSQAPSASASASSGKPHRKQAKKDKK